MKKVKSKKSARVKVKKKATNPASLKTSYAAIKACHELNVVHGRFEK